MFLCNETEKLIDEQDLRIKMLFSRKARDVWCVDFYFLIKMNDFA